MIANRQHPIARDSLKSGFTLIEVLIATAMFAVVLAALNTVFYGALRLTTKSSEASEKLLPRHETIRIITDDLRFMAPPGGTLGGQIVVGQGSAMQSSSTSPQLEFHTTTGVVGHNLPWGEVQKVAYYLRPQFWFTNTLGYELIRATTRNLLPSIEENPIEQPLLPEVEALEFAFYDGQSWLDTWDSTTQETPLKAVQVRIHLARKPSELQPKLPLEIVVPVMVEASTNTVSNSSGSTGSTGPQSGNNNGGPQQPGGPGGAGGPQGGGGPQPGGPR